MSFVEEISLRADDKASSVITGLSSKLKGLLRDLGALAGVTVGFAGLTKLVQTGIQFNAMIEDSRNSIAGIVGALHTYRSATGEVLQGEEKWQASLQSTAVVQERLRIAALTTTATYSEMVDAFTVGVGPMTRAGIALSDTAEATQRLTQVAAAASIPMAQLAIEIRQFFNGDVMRGRLLQTLQITKDQIEAHKKQGDMMDFIRQKTESYARAAQAAAESMTGRVSNLKDAIEQVLGVGLQPLYERLKGTLGAITDQFVSIGRDSKGNLTAQFNQDLVARVREFGEALAQILAKLTPLAAVSITFLASFLGAGAKAVALFAPVLDVLTAIVVLLTKVSDSVGEWAVGLYLVAKAFGAVEAAAKAAMIASAAARGLSAGGGAGAGAAAGAVAGVGTSLLGSAAVGSTLGMAAVGADLVYLSNQVAKEIGDKLGVMFDSRVQGQKAWYDVRTDSQVLAESQSSQISSTLGAAQWSAASRGQTELARNIESVAVAFRSQSISADEAIKRLRELGPAGKQAFEANKEAADPAVLEKYSDAILKINGQIQALGQTGLSAALTKSKTDYLGDMSKLKADMREAGTEEEKKAILQQVGARADLWQAEQAKAFRDYRNELAKQKLELTKESESIAQVWLEGGAKEVAAISSKAADTVAALQNERAQVAATDSAAVEKIKGITAQIRLALERRGAELAEWARAAWNKYRDVETQAIQTTLESEGRDAESQFIGLREKYRKLREDLNNALVGAMANPKGDGAIGQIVATIRAIGTAEAAETEKLTRENHLRLATVQGDWRAMAEDIKRRVSLGLLNARDALKETGDAMVRFGKTYGEGAMGAIYGIMATIPTAAESAASAVNGVWSAMTRSFDDLFFNVLSGRLDSLKDVFKNLWQSILQTASRFMSDLLQRWIRTQIDMGNASGSGTPGVTSTDQWGRIMGAPGSGSKSGGWWGKALGYVGAAGTGFGLGSGIGSGGAGNQWGGALGAVGGLALGSTAGVISGVGSALGLGAAAGSVVPIIGTIIGALIGAIIGGVFNKNTERSMSGSLGAMAGATRWDFVQPWTKRNGEERPGYWTGTVEAPTTAFERSGQSILQGQAAGFADIFRVGAKDQASSLIASYQKALKEALSGANFKISAGSEEDIQKDADFLLKSLLPRIGLSAAFGQKGYLPAGQRDRQGGIPGINYGMPGMDELGFWAEKKLFDAEAPIPKMLAGLGFTAAKIGEIAGRISTDDPEKLLAYLQGVVGVVVGIRDLGAEMGKTYGELTKGWSDETAKGQAAAFGNAAQDLAAQWDALSLYSGDEQMKKAQEAQAASDQFWQSVVSYLQQLDALGQKLSAGFQGLRERMRAFLNPLSESGQTTADWSIVNGTWGKLQNAKTPAEIETASTDAAAAIERMFAVLVERVTRGKALLDRLTGLTGNLWNMGKDVAAAELERTNPLEAWGNGLVDIQTKVGAAATKSGLEQITAIEDVAAAGEDVYGKLKAFIADIASVRSGVNKSIDSQVWELGVGEMDARGQAGAVTQRVKELQDQLKLATSPAEIQAITQEIQSLTSRYVGTFGKDDKDRAAAIAWAQEQLDRAKGLANEALDALDAQAKALATQLETTLKTATGLISTNVSDAATQIGQLSHTLGALDEEMRKAIERLGQGALDSLAPLRAAMDTAAGIFTGATATAGAALTGSDASFSASVDRSTSRLNSFAEALDRAISKLNGIGGTGAESGSGTGPKTENYAETVTPARTTATAVVTYSRRFAGQMTPRVA